MSKPLKRLTLPPIPFNTQLKQGVNENGNVEERSGMRTKAALFLPLEPVAERVAVAAFETAFLALPFTGFDEVLETARALLGGFTADGASAVAFHAQLVLSLPGDGQLRKFIFDDARHSRNWRVRAPDQEDCFKSAINFFIAGDRTLSFL